MSRLDFVAQLIENNPGWHVIQMTNLKVICLRPDGTKATIRIK